MNVDIFSYNNYRTYLRELLSHKIANNGSFSLRAFSQHLGITHSSLSQVLNGKRHLSQQRALDISLKLGLNSKEQDYFQLMVQVESIKDPEQKRHLLDKMKMLNPQVPSFHLDVEIFKVISEWYHFPILSLARLDKFDLTPVNVQRALGISALDASLAIERLVRLGLLSRNEEGRYIVTHSRILSESETPSSALRKFHAQMLEKAIEALKTQTPQEKINGSETFIFNDKDLEEAKEITEEYFQRMLSLSQKSRHLSQGHDVYHLQVNFFRLTQNMNEILKENKYEFKN